MSPKRLTLFLIFIIASDCKSTASFIHALYNLIAILFCVYMYIYTQNKIAVRFIYIFRTPQWAGGIM